MKRGLAICETIHIASLGVWLGALLMTGVAAAFAFPTMAKLNPALPDYAAYPGPQGPIAAGNVMVYVFGAFDLLQLTLATLAAASFGIAVAFFGLSMRKNSTFLRMMLLIGLLITLSISFFIISPAANQHLQSFWEAARDGRLDEAAASKAAFDAAHPRATLLLTITLILLFLSLLTSLWSALRLPSGADKSAPIGAGAIPHPMPPSPSAAPVEAPLEEPLLARKAR